MSVGEFVVPPNVVDNRDPRDRYPTVARWLANAPEQHPWQFLFRERDPISTGTAQAMEEILEAIERAAPDRLARKQTEFVRDAPGALNLRAELNVGGVLSRS